MSDDNGNGPKKRFSLRNPRRVITIRVITPGDEKDGYEPIVFNLRLALSKEAQDRRQKWVGMTRSERTQTALKQVMDEVADLLVDDPAGFEDWPEGDAAPGVKLNDYYILAQKDPEAKFWFEAIMGAVHDLYYNEVTPREFSQ